MVTTTIRTQIIALACVMALVVPPEVVVRTAAVAEAVAQTGTANRAVPTSPAEMLLLRGAPVYQPVPGTSLLWVSNTDSDVFRLGKAGNFYYLVAGRWFSAPSLNGPWTFATLQLPEDFRKISVDTFTTSLSAEVPRDIQGVPAASASTGDRPGRTCACGGGISGA